MKVDGATQMVETTGTWFRCRLTLPQAPEALDSAQGRRRTRPSPSIIYPLRDTAGSSVDVRAADRLEVDSIQLTSVLTLLDSSAAPAIRLTAEGGGYRAALSVTVVDHPTDPLQSRLTVLSGGGVLETYDFLDADVQGLADAINAGSPRLRADQVTSGTALALVDEVPMEYPIWEVVGAPEPIRRKRSVMGWQVSLRRVADAGEA